MAATNHRAAGSVLDHYRGFMLGLLKSSFIWQFAGGFLLGAAGLVALHAAPAAATSTAPVAQTR